MTEKHVGKCALCGEEKELTFEHVPPHKAFNWFPAKIVTHETVLNRASTDRKPWDFSGLPYTDSQRGLGAYTLCRQCNNNTGIWYGNDYIEFVMGLYYLVVENQLKAGTTLFVENEKFSPLPVMKQIISMFCSINHDAIIADKYRKLREYVLDKTSSTFPKDQYRLGMYLFLKGMRRIVPISAKIKTGHGVNPSIEMLSEIASYPVGFILYFDPNSDLKMPCLDITPLCECGYQEECKVELPLPVYQCNTLFPADFRSKVEIERSINMSKKV
jgi:hypothetical protein